MKADTSVTTPAGRAATDMPGTSAQSGPRLLPAVEARAKRASPGIAVVAISIEMMLARGRKPATSLFWTAPLARHAAVLVAARRCPGRMPTCADLVALGLSEAASVTSDAAMADAAARLGLTS